MWLLMWIEDIGNQYEVRSEYGKEVGKGDEKGDDKDVGSPTKKRKKEDDETEDEEGGQDQDKKTEQMLDVSAETPNQPPKGLTAAALRNDPRFVPLEQLYAMQGKGIAAFRNDPRFVPLEQLYAMQGKGIFAVPGAEGAEGANL